MSPTAMGRRFRRTCTLSSLAYIARRIISARFAALLLTVAWPAWAATTYTYTSSNYINVIPFTSPCSAGTCANYTTSMHLAGSFSTATPLAANLSGADVRAQVTSFSFNDGINTYTSSDPNVRLLGLQLSTDSSGVPIGSNTFLDIQQWTSGTVPHTAGNRFNAIFVNANPDDFNNVGCLVVGTFNGVTDACTANAGDSNQSEGQAGSAGTWTVSGGPPPPPGPGAVTPVPTLGTLPLGALAALLVMVGWFTRRCSRRG